MFSLLFLPPPLPGAAAADEGAAATSARAAGRRPGAGQATPTAPRDIANIGLRPHARGAPARPRPAAYFAARSGRSAARRALWIDRSFSAHSAASLWAMRTLSAYSCLSRLS